MSEEERKAIEYFKYQIELAHKDIEKHKDDEFKGYGTMEDVAKMRYCNLKIVLNLIEKQQAEIEKKDKIIDEMAEWLSEDDTSFGYGNLKEVNTEDKIKLYFEKKVEVK